MLGDGLSLAWIGDGLGLAVDFANDLLGQLSDLVGMVYHPAHIVPDEPLFPEMAVADAVSEVMDQALGVAEIGQMEFTLSSRAM